MSRLDDEYDKAEHHQLKRIDEQLGSIATRTEYSPVCWCNRRGCWRSNKAAAYQAHNRHRDEQ